ncbi:MAG TPA: tetratricopeptide repeat protein, partial [Pirellulales bacterium]|nr:tetratricopeptide repeat protein [Pirellulales bacterium]
RIAPGSADAHINLGNTLKDLGEADEALVCYRKAVSIRPDDAAAHFNFGNLCRDMGDPGEAAAHYRSALRIRPAFAEAHNNLGNALSQQGKRAEAAKCFERATKIDSQFADAYNNLGNVLRELGRHAKAIAAFERALAIRPKFAEAHNNLGIAWSARRNYDQALACYAEALRLWPDYAAAHNNRGIALANRGDWADAIVNYRRALELKPDYAEAMNNLGIVLSQQGEYEEAIALYKRAIELKPDYAEAFSNMGITLTECRRIDEALEGYAQALEHKENYPDARMNRALSYLIRGDFERGWREYEWRWKCKDFNARKFGKPAWDGSPLHGRRIMFHAEQGFGDTFQFIRYARLVKERYDCTVILWCPKQLVPLVREIPYIDEVTIEGEPIPEIDVHLPLLSLPMVFGTTVETVPGEVPYLYAKPELIERWRKELSYIGALKIGIAWKGNPRYRGDRHRSIPLERFAPLADIPGVRLIGLQKGLGTEQIAQLNDRFSLTELPASRDEAAGSFMDTAAILKNIDLVISCDSSLTHLAGSLGVPVWLAQSLASDWRWLLNRDDSPWYPALRIFRQKTLGDWEEVFERMAGELRALV